MEIPSTKRATEKCYVVAARTPTCRRSFRQDARLEEAPGVNIYPASGGAARTGRRTASGGGHGDDLRAWRRRARNRGAGASSLVGRFGTLLRGETRR
jgi:hypothetical protein